MIDSPGTNTNKEACRPGLQASYRRDENRLDRRLRFPGLEIWNGVSYERTLFAWLQICVIASEACMDRTEHNLDSHLGDIFNYAGSRIRNQCPFDLLHGFGLSYNYQHYSCRYMYDLQMKKVSSSSLRFNPR